MCSFERASLCAYLLILDAYVGVCVAHKHERVCACFCVCVRERERAGSVNAGHPLVKCARAELAVCVWPVCVCVCARACVWKGLAPCSGFMFPIWLNYYYNCRRAAHIHTHTHTHKHRHTVTVCVLISRAHTVQRMHGSIRVGLIFDFGTVSPFFFFSHSHHLFHFTSSFSANQKRV